MFFRTILFERHVVILAHNKLKVGKVLYTIFLEFGKGI